MTKFNNNLKRIISQLLIMFFLVPLCYGNDTENPEISQKKVTERELLMLTILSYNNEPQEDVTKIGDETFNAKWFAGYGDASELKDWKVVDHIINKSAREMDGFSVITYKNDNNVVIAFRGTDSGIIKENWQYFFKKEHPQAKHVTDYISKLTESSFIDDNTKIYITGHSLGGYLAIYALGKVLINDTLKDKLVKTVTFNGLGLGHLTDKVMFKTLSNVTSHILVNYAIKTDVVSLLGKHFTDLVYLKPFPAKSALTPKTINKNPHFPYNFLAQKPFLNNNSPET